MHLTDAPGDYKEVWIDIQSVEVHFETDGEGEWITLYELDLSEGPYDLLKLTNEVYELLASADLPAGTISQIRLVLGDENSVVVEVEGSGSSEEPVTEGFALKTPSAQTSGLKLNVHAQLEAGVTYNMWIDFDADKSIVSTGSGNYNLKPVIRTYTEATSGGIKGFVTPIDSETSVTVTVDGEDVTTIIDAGTGFFMLSGIPEGTYDVVFTPGDISTYLERIIEGVGVEKGVVTDLGEVEMENK